MRAHHRQSALDAQCFFEPPSPRAHRHQEQPRLQLLNVVLEETIALRLGKSEGSLIDVFRNLVLKDILGAQCENREYEDRSSRCQLEGGFLRSQVVS